MTLKDYEVLRNLINSEVEKVLTDPSKDKFDVFMAVQDGIYKAGLLVKSV